MTSLATSEITTVLPPLQRLVVRVLFLKVSSNLRGSRHCQGFIREEATSGLISKSKRNLPLRYPAKWLVALCLATASSLLPEQQIPSLHNSTFRLWLDTRKSFLSLLFPRISPNSILRDPWGNSNLSSVGKDFKDCLSEGHWIPPIFSCAGRESHFHRSRDRPSETPWSSFDCPFVCLFILSQVNTCHSFNYFSQDMAS